MSRFRLMMFAVLIVAVALAVSTGMANDARKATAAGTQVGVRQGQPPQRAVGTIQYDNDTPFRRLPNTDAFVGNRFNDGVVDPHSIASMSFRLAQNYGGGVVLSIWDVNPANVQILRRWYVSGIPSSNVTPFTFSVGLATGIAVHTGSFLAGVHNTFYTGFGCATDTGLNGTCDGVALTQGTGGVGPPFHGVTVNLNGGVFSPPTTLVNSTGQDLGTANAIVRVTGDNLPVELMNLDVE